jgi:hypothetical protein
VTPSQVGRVNIDLHDLCLVGVKLPPGKVCAQHQKRIAIQQGVVAGLVAEHPGHSDVVRVIKLEEVFCARRMRDWRLQLVGNRENLLMRALTARPTVQLNIFAFVENFRHLGKIGVVRPRDGPGDMHRVRDSVIHYRGGDIRRHDQNGNTAFRQGRLASHHGLPARLFRRMDHVAEDAAVPVDLLEVDLLDEIEAQFVANDLTCDQDDGRTIAIGLVYSVDEVQATGTAAPGNCRQTICYQRVRLRGKRSCFFMSH